MKGLLLMAVLCLPLVACGPVSQKTAEQQCFERARLASGPRGTIAVGGGSNGPAADFDVTVSSDYLTGKDPSQVYESCVAQKTGQFPSVPLTMRPDWKG